jgi:Rrf2 family protein
MRLNKSDIGLDMLKFSKKVEYALIAMIDIASHQTYDLVTAKALSQQYNIPAELLGKVLQSLTRKGLLQSVQGVKGGYTITEPLEKISMLRVIEAIDGPINLTSCSADKRCVCEQLLHCNIRNPMEIIRSELSQFFSGISLQTIKNQQKPYSAAVLGAYKQ